MRIEETSIVIADVFNGWMETSCEQRQRYSPSYDPSADEIELPDILNLEKEPSDELAAIVASRALESATKALFNQVQLETIHTNEPTDIYGPDHLITTFTIVRERLTSHMLASTPQQETNFARAAISAEVLDARRQRAIRIGRDAVNLGPDPEKKLINNMMDIRHNWIDVATGCITLATKIRKGKLGAVPLLKPKSIPEDPQIYYPFTILDS